MSAEWVRVDLDAVEKYGADAAVVLGLIDYRCNITGEWEATVETIAAEARLKVGRVRSALRILRDTGTVHSHRADRFRPHLTWSVFPGITENAESTITRMQNRAHPEMAESVISSYTEAQEEIPLLVPVEKPAPKTRRKSPAKPYPADFRPSAAHWALAQSLGVDLTHEGPHFTDHHVARGSTFSDWDAALRTWIRNAAKFARERTPATAAPAAPEAVYATTDGLRRLPAPVTDPFARGNR